MEEVKKKHALFGIISLFIALIGITAVSIPMFINVTAILTGDKLPENPFIHSLSAAGILLNPVGIVLGIFALFQKNKKHLFAITGLILNLFVTALAASVLYGVVRLSIW